MAITSGGQISLTIKESAPEPQTLFVQTVPASTFTDADGNVSIRSWRTLIGVLHSKTMTIEGRGYSGPINRSGSSDVVWWTEKNEDDDIVSTESFIAKSVAYDQQRINEAGFWRITKTVTVTSLYINNNPVAGKTDFDDGDYTI